MTKERRQWSKDQKLRIIQEVEVNGLQPTLRKYNCRNRCFINGNAGLMNRAYWALRLNTLKLIR
jgi:hypothetical protein